MVQVAELNLSRQSVRTNGLLWTALMSVRRHRPSLDRGYLFRAFSRIVRSVASRSPNAMISVRYEDDTVFSFPAADNYWARLLYHDADIYEPEIENFLKRFAMVDFSFIDLGANMGYWSTRVSGPDFGSKEVVAVEAARDTFALLEHNAIINGNRFERLHRAISDSSGEMVNLSGNSHAGKSIKPAWNPAEKTETVETITIDDLLADNKASSFVIKLDVEGVEPAAIRGSILTLQRDSIFIYEDHGKESSHIATRTALEHGNVYLIDGQRYLRVRDADEVEAIKKERHRGYNFFLTASSFWIDRIENAI